MDENDRCDQHGRSLDHPWGCFGCSMAEYLSKDPTTWEPRFPILSVFPKEGLVEGPYKIFTEGGHAFQLDEEAKLDTWEHGIHDGFICILCGEPICRNCDPDWKTQKCPDNQPAIPGLELEVTDESSRNR